MRRGRRPSPAHLVERLDGSAEAKRRVVLILETLAGRQTLAEVGRLLGLSERRLHTLREQMLQEAVWALQPRPSGRPARAAPRGAADPRDEELRLLRVELKAAQVREEIARVLPHLEGPRRGAARRETRRKQS